ncbi:hypothetical protein [Streptomyces anulatus]|uniref:hypothetical protein n=1 Tax=Streptomyces anulatus TaxID=1892 RepID=UPI00386DBEF6
MRVLRYCGRSPSVEYRLAPEHPLARDRGTPRLAFQMLPYPMLDDRNITLSCHTGTGIWDRAANLQAWRALLGEWFGGDSPGRGHPQGAVRPPPGSAWRSG